MSFESFRAEFSSLIRDRLPDDAVSSVLSSLDELSQSWDFQKKSTDLIVSDGLPEAVRLYIATKSIENVKKGTLYNYTADLRNFFRKVAKPVNSVEASDVRLYLAWYKSERKVKDCTLDRIRIALKGFFTWCVEEDMIKKNPLRHVQPIRCADPERLPMTALELEKVRSACRTLREKALVDFLYSTAARVSELSNLDIRHVNLTDHTVRIEHGKGDKGRTTFLNAEAEISLRAYLASRTDDCPALFVNLYGEKRRMKKRSIEDEICRIVSRCDLSVHVTPHIFRHTAASLALQRGMPIEQVQRFLGHARIQTTLRYAKILSADVKNAHAKYVA